MSTEPNPKMDQLLKAYADKRRSEAGAPLEIHPATRTMLHGEAARTFSRGSAAHAGKRWNPTGLWPRLALAGSTIALLMILGSVYWQQMPRLSQPAPVNEAASSKDFQTEAPQATSALTETQPLRWQFAQSPSRQFLSTHRDEKDVAGPQNILVSFSMEQMGNQIRIVDADGSIYVGQIEPSENKRSQQQAAEMEKPGKPAEAGKMDSSEGSKQEDVRRKAKEMFEKNRSMQTSRDFTFHVKGTSVTLQKAVEFQGSFLATDIEAARGDWALTKSENVGGGTKSGADVEEDAAAPAELGAVRRDLMDKLKKPASIIRIQGKALIEDGSVVEINAALVEPK